MIKILRFSIISFQSVGGVTFIGQVNIVLNVLFKETKQILEIGHGRFLYTKEKIVRITKLFFVFRNKFLTCHFKNFLKKGTVIAKKTFPDFF